MRWTVLIPAKALPAAKSRLATSGGDPESHRRLVEAIRSDTFAAAYSAHGVARVVVVTDLGDPAPDVLVQTEPGLNPAVREGAEYAVRSWPGDGVAALVGDLPAMRPDELSAALAAATDHGTAFVPDATGIGTTLLTATPGHHLSPAFGLGSAEAHRAGGAVELSAGPGLRHDVDTPSDLDAAHRELGVGPATTAVLRTSEPDVTVRSTSLEMIREHARSANGTGDKA